ncbi:diadenylate cyclase [Hymenobacter arcticus]
MNATPKDLAKFVFNKLKHAKTRERQPPLAVLTTLFENLFFTSLQTEEGQLIKVTVTLLDAENPDPNPPRKKVAHRWTCVPFGERIPFTVKNLVKLSKAADPWSTSLAVDYDAHNELFIWGLIDQSYHYRSFINYESTFSPEQPGLFRTAINDIGNLHVMLDYELIANLKHNVLISNYVDVFASGPVRELLGQHSTDYQAAVRQHFTDELGSDVLDDWSGYLNNVISRSLCRILLKMQDYQHGGAFLITPDTETGLSIKHRLAYDRLFRAIVQFVKFDITSFTHTETILNEYIDLEQDTLPSHLYLQENVAETDKNETSDELKGAIMFVASLSCIDGLVVLSPDLEVRGFGVVIRSVKAPDFVYVATQATVEEPKLLPVSPSHYGTRHRSMFAYCWNHAGSLGFVVSQDGDIRAITRVGDKLIMWENIKVQQFIKSKRLFRPHQHQGV